MNGYSGYRKRFAPARTSSTIVKRQYKRANGRPVRRLRYTGGTGAYGGKPTYGIGAPNGLLNGRFNGRKPEMKFCDNLITDTVMTQGGTFTLINNVAQGTDFNARIGRQFYNKYCMVRCLFYLPTPPSTGLSSNTCRVMIVWDEQPNAVGLVAGTGGLLPVLNVGSSNTGFVDSTSMMNLNNRMRFRVIADEFCDLCNFGKDQHQFNIFRKINRKTENIGTDNTIASISTGALYCIVLDSNGVVANDTVTYAYYSRVTFIDP